MVLGFSLPVFALIHVLISLVGIFAGLVVVGGFMSGRLLRGWTGLFLVTTILTNVTGFFFPFAKLLPSHILGGLSLVLLPLLFRFMENTSRRLRKISHRERGHSLLQCEHEHSLRVDETGNEPRTGNPVDLGVFPRNPAHGVPPSFAALTTFYAFGASAIHLLDTSCRLRR